MDNKKSKYIFIVLSVLCMMMIVISSVKDGIMNPIRNTIGYVLVPFQTGVNSVGFGIYENLKEHRTLQEVEEENKKLSEKIDLLTEQNNRLTLDSGELSRLRELYELDQEYMQYEKIAARVIAKDSENWFQVFRIDKGSQDGIRVDQNVMANGGLIGIVTDVGLNYATVRSIIDDESRVSAMGLQSSDTCIVAGDLTLYEQGRLRITDIKKDTSIQEGDRIVTSNISAKFMPGILIGYAVDVKEDDKRLMKDGYLIPAADFNDLSEVLVLKQVKSDSFLDENSGDGRVAPKSSNADEALKNVSDSNIKVAETWAGMEGLTPLGEIDSTADPNGGLVTAKDIVDTGDNVYNAKKSDETDTSSERQEEESDDSERRTGTTKKESSNRTRETEAEEGRETEVRETAARETVQAETESSAAESPAETAAQNNESEEELIEENPN
ncbi:rod shape-determining protein MreC [Lachnospiraceae bacterium JC7]|nr:rod shape-determining protein MreC [Lachnospiraceae bacterium JC7]